MFPVNLQNILAAEQEEYLENIRLFNQERRSIREETDPFSMSNALFQKTFRLNKDMAQYILNRILPDINVTDNVVAVPAHLKFFAALYFFATGSYQKLIGQSFNIMSSQSLVSRSVTEVTNSIVNRLGNEWIIFPTTVATKNAIKARFMEMTGFPGTIGAIDCTHVAILAPREEEHNYLNRKQYHSKNVQMICDYNLKILNVNARYPGATHDSFIWRNSFVKTELEILYNEGDHNTWLLGDSGYPQQPWIMTPILNVRARNCVERCNGLLKCRFRCMLQERVLRYTPEKTGNIINTCAILHNICVNGNLDIDFDIPPPKPHEFNDENDIIHMHVQRERQIA